MKNITYDKDLVRAYINGNTIKGHSEDELEDNYQFMLDVLAMSKDCNMFYYASDRVKNNIDYVVKSIKIFRENKPFIEKVYNEFLKNNPDRRQKFTIYLYNMFKDDKSPFANKIKKEADKVFEELDIDGTFKSLTKAYDDSVKLDFMARRYVNDIFYNDEKYTFSGVIHNNLTKKEMKSMKPASFVMKYIKSHEYALGDYIFNVKYDIINNVFKDVKDEFKKWNSYEKELNDIRVKKVIMKLYKYIKDGNNEVQLQDLLSYIVYNLDLKDSFELFDEHNPIKELKYDKYKDNYSNVDASVLPSKYTDLENEIKTIYKKDYVGERKK